MTTLPDQGYLLRLYIGEDDLHGSVPLWQWIVKQAKNEGLAGATVLRGVSGYGAHSRLHTTRILRLSTDLPLVVEIVDTREKIEAFMPLIDEVVGEGLATLEKVEIRFYRSRDGETREKA